MDDQDFPQVITLSPEAHAKFLDAINNPKPPTPALVELMRGTKEEKIKRVADAMQAKRAELIAHPLARIWEDLAKVAIQEAGK